MDALTWLGDARATARIGALIGVPARANMLSALMDGRALTATELSLHAGVTPQTASSHLSKLIDAELVTVEKQGRHRYYRLARASVAEAIEPLCHLVRDRPVPPHNRDRRLEELREARMCYDHLAGVMGVALADALLDRGLVTEDDADFQVTDEGRAAFVKLNIDLDALSRRRRVFARRCLDWSERRPHIGGALGAALAERFTEEGWIERIVDSRKVVVTAKGKRALHRRFGIKI